jgi:tetratricopeptide (TPR) repeat protein
MIKKSVFVLVFCILLIPPSQCSNGVTVQEDTQFTAVMSEANTYFEQENYNLAIGKYDDALEIDNNSVEAYLNRGKAYFYMNNFVRAGEDFSEALLLDPSCAEAVRYRGWSNYNNGAIDRALSDFEELVKLEPDKSYSYFGRGWCYINKAQWSQSSLLYLYQKFESDAGLMEAYKDKSWHYVKDMQWELAALPDIAGEVKDVPDIAEVICNRGFACFKKAQWDAAIRDLEKQITFNPSLDRGKWNLEWANGKKQEWNLAIDDYNKIAGWSGLNKINVDIKKDNLQTWYDLAVDDYQYVIDSSDNSELVLKAQNALDYMEEWRQQMNWQFIN